MFKQIMTVWVFGLLLIVLDQPVQIEAQPDCLDSGVQAAIDCADAGSTLILPAGTYNGTLVIDKDLTLTGTRRDQTILDAAAAGRVLTIRGDVTVTLRDLTLIGGQAPQGGGVFIEQGNLTLESVTIVGNTATQQGGGLYTRSAAVQMIDSLLAYNRIDGEAEAAGGGLFTHNGAVTITDSRLTANQVTAATCDSSPAFARGGAIYSEAAMLTLTNSTIAHNIVQASSCDIAVVALAQGSGLFVAAGTVNVDALSQVTDHSVRGESAVVQGTIEMARIVLLPESAEMMPVVAESSQDQLAALAVDWMETVNNAVKAEGLTPPYAARIFAYMGVTLYEALVPGMPENRSLVGQLAGLDMLPQSEMRLEYDWPLVASAALHTVALGLFETAAPATIAQFDALYEAQQAQRGDIASFNAYGRSISFGETLGQAILDWAAADNYEAIHQLRYTIPAGNPAYWVPLAGQEPLAPYWGLLRPFGLPLASYCDVPLAIPFSTDPASAFYGQVREVYDTVVNLTPEQRQIAQYWSDDPGSTATPPGHWIYITGHVIRQLNLPLERAAEVYALTGIAVGDAFIAAWESKYRYQLVRPITYIQTHIDPNWQTVVQTPPFPEYPSGHSVVSGAAAGILTYLLGPVAFDDSGLTADGRVIRQFTSFNHAAEEAAMSRLYGGIHYRVAIENGLEQGECVANHLINTIRLRN